MKIAYKLVGGYLLVALLVTVVAYSGIRGVGLVSHAFDQVTKETLPTVESLENLRFAGLRIVASTNEYGFIISERRKVGRTQGTQEAEELEEVADGKQAYFAALQKYRETLQLTFPTALPAEEMATLKSLQSAGQLILGRSDEVIALKKQASRGTIVLEKREELEYAELAFLKAVDVAIKDEYLQLAARRANVESSIEAVRSTDLLVGAAAFSMALVIGFAISYRISSPIAKLKEASREIGEGRLNTRIEVGANDEIGDLARTFNGMAADLEQSRHEIIASKDFLDNIIRSMVDSLVVTRPDGTITMVNQATLEMLGYQENG